MIHENQIANIKKAIEKYDGDHKVDGFILGGLTSTGLICGNCGCTVSGVFGSEHSKWGDSKTGR